MGQPTNEDLGKLAQAMADFFGRVRHGEVEVNTAIVRLDDIVKGRYRGHPIFANDMSQYATLVKDAKPQVRKIDDLEKIEFVGFLQEGEGSLLCKEVLTRGKDAGANLSQRDVEQIVKICNATPKDERVIDFERRRNGRRLIATKTVWESNHHGRHVTRLEASSGVLKVEGRPFLTDRMDSNDVLGRFVKGKV